VKDPTNGAHALSERGVESDSLPIIERIKHFFEHLGPGIITGASDDDPSGIATYSQVGAQFGFAMLWTMLFSYPLMAGIQEISASIGRVTGMGIAANIRRHYPVWVLYPIVILIRMKVDWFLAAVMDQAHARQMTVARGQNGRKN
jgi:NRAMP (natural resistance-associated macrophage protein)-like metal ion transporter